VASERRSLSEARIFSPHNKLIVLLATALFLLWGIPANLNDVLIRQFMKSFEINRFQAGLIQSAFHMSYIVLALPAAAGALLFWPAAVVRQYGFFCLPCSSWPAA
jgi:FHS family L-fucose permease-like MFS transporter